MSPKELKKLADACRKAGIKHYKQGDIEFTLADAPPVSDYKRAKMAKAPKPAVQASNEIDSDGPTAEELLFWSAASGADLLEDSEEHSQ
jgi:hypothetical protein